MQLPVHRILSSHDRRQASSVQLYAGTNVMSPGAERVLASRIGVMPAIGRPHAKQQPGTSEISLLEELVESQLHGLFGGRWAEPRLQSCTIANAAIYAAFSKPGDTIASIPASEGGHVSHHINGTVGLLDRTTISLPFKDGRYDDRGAGELIRAQSPKIVMLGASVMLDSYEVEQTVAACRSAGSLLVYDASHVLGLIAGKRFQNPLEIGADIMTASTYKSLGGPPGGIVVGRHSRHEDVVRNTVTGAWTSNFDAARLAALSVALAETAEFGGAYADAMLANAAVLHCELRTRGLDVVRGVDESPCQPQTHQLLVRCSDRQEAERLSRSAEAAGFLLGTGRVPGEPAAGGIRLGTQAVTRCGAGADEMRLIAEALGGIVRGEALTGIASARQTLTARLARPGFCFPDCDEGPKNE